MINTINALLPVFLVICIGLAIRKTHYLPDSIWPALDQLCWFLLFPLLIIRTLSEADLSSVPIEGLASALLISVALMIILLIGLKPLLTRWAKMSGPSYTSFFQGTSRWNGFAALAIIQALYGDDGLVLGALSFAVMVPVLQTANVVVLSVFGEPEDQKSTSFSMKRLIIQLIRNPMLISCFIGISLNLLDWTVGTTMKTTVQLISASALGLSLLAVGAGLRFSALQNTRGSLILSSVLKLLVMPLFIAGACVIMNVSGLPYEVAIICGAAPTAGTAYIMARQMGGDAEMVAAIITFQTLLAVVTLPGMLFLLTG